MARSSTQRWNDSLEIGQSAVERVIEFLECCSYDDLWYPTRLVMDVQSDARFQPLGIDLLWFVQGVESSCCFTLEVKADRNATTGNFFFETLSDIEQETLGAFLSTQAEWYFYYFLPSDTLYCIPLLSARSWFLKHRDEFEQRQSSSSRNGRYWKTLGRLVPISRLVNEVKDTHCFRRKSESLWERLSSAFKL